MGQLWQPFVNDAFNTALEGVCKAVEAENQRPGLMMAPAFDAARAVARNQRLDATSAALTRFEQSLAAGTVDPARAAKIVQSIRRNAQVRILGAGDAPVTGPTLIYLSGFLTTDPRNDYVAGSFGRIGELIRGRAGIRRQPALLGWTHTNLKNLFNLAAYNTFPGFYASKAGYDLGAAVLMPLVAGGFRRDPQSGALSGTPLPKDQAARNLANVTFFGYSAGTILAQETYNATRRMMGVIGFNDADAVALLHNVVLLSTGTVSRPSKEGNRFTTIVMAASNDRLMRAKNLLWGFAGTVLRLLTFKPYVWKKNRRPLSITPLSKTSLFVTTSVRPSLYEWQYDMDGSRAGRRPFSPLYPAWTQRRSYHELPPYLTTDDANNRFSRIALYTLVNAFNRTGLVEPASLLNVPAQDDYSPALQDAYKNRIKAAMRPARR